MPKAVPGASLLPARSRASPLSLSPSLDAHADEPTSPAGWTKPIIVGRHAFGDQYRSTDIVVPEAGKLELVYTPDDKAKQATNLEVFHFKGPGVGLAMYNTKQSITDFAQSSFKLAIEKKLPLVRLLSPSSSSECGCGRVHEMRKSCSS